jgi:hypothetical protein
VAVEIWSGLDDPRLSALARACRRITTMAEPLRETRYAIRRLVAVSLVAVGSIAFLDSGI